MPQFTGHGLRFDYPEGWTLEEDPEADGHLHLQSPGLAFWTLSVLPADVSVTEAVEAAVAALREDYRELDRYDDALQWDGTRSAGCDVNFVYLDMVNSASIRATALPQGTVLIFYQGEDQELEQWRPQLEAITRSLCAQDDAE